MHSLDPRLDSCIQFSLEMATEEPTERVLHVLLGVTGSVASIKAVQLVRSLKEGTSSRRSVWSRVEVRVIATEKASHFFDLDALKQEADGVFVDADEWQWSKRGDPVLHIGM